MPVDHEEFANPGRWILSPKRGSRFLGPRERARARARERRRRVFVFLLEAIGLTGLMGMFPPLRGMLYVTGFFAVLLAAYVVLVVQATRSRSAAPEPDRVLVLPEAEPPPGQALVEEQDRRLVRVAVR